MFYELCVKGYVRIPPNMFNKEIKDAILQRLNEDFEGYISKELGFIICITDIISVGEGKIIHGDGAAYYETEFKLITYIPELQEIVKGKITDITNFGAFITLGSMQGMIHISQTMDDYVSFSKTNTLVGKSGKKSLKKGDNCLARIVAISYKLGDPKIGLTMRQPGLGKIEWMEEEKKQQKKAAKDAARIEKTEKPKGKKK